MKIGNANGNSDLREFGEFRLDVEKCVLWRDSEPVNLQPKEIEILSALTENPGALVSKQELMDRVWPNAFVEESNLSRHIYRLRRAFESCGLNGSVIQTVPRRGYRFTGDISTNGSEVLVFERRSVSRTLIEELHTSDPPDARSLSAAPLRQSRVVLPIALAVLILTTSFGVYLYNRLGNADTTLKSIAVLPFKSFENDEMKALGLGFADTLSANLGRMQEIRVLSNDVIDRERLDTQEPAEIGRSLGVDAVIDGTLQRANGKLRVTLRLIRITDGKQLWNDSFDGSEEAVFRMQDAIATEMARVLALNFSLKNREAVLKRYTLNADAYQAYQNGRYLHLQTEYKRAIREFERALQFDSKYVLAYTGLADSYSQLANRSTGQNRVELYEKAKSFALQALAFDESLAEAHASLGWIRRIYDWDWAESEKHLRRAIEFDPNSPSGYSRLASLYATLGRTKEAVQLSEKVLERDPLSGTNGWMLYCDRQYEESAVAYVRRMTIESSPEKQTDGRLGAAMAYTQLGKHNEALDLLLGLSPEHQNDYKVAVTIAIARFRNGQTDAAIAMLPDLEEKAAKADGRWVRLAYVYAAMKMNDKAIDALEKGLETRDDRLMWIKIMPYFDRLKDEPRFRAILNAMGLPA